MRIAALDRAAQFKAAAAGEKDVRNHQVGIDILHSQQRGLAVGDADDFESLIEQNPLTHALRMGAVISEQDDAQLSGEVVLAESVDFLSSSVFFFFLSFFFLSAFLASAGAEEAAAGADEAAGLAASGAGVGDGAEDAGFAAPAAGFARASGLVSSA